MVLCFVALFIFAVLGIFSAKYRDYFNEAVRCVFRKITLRPCETALDQKIKMAIISKIFAHNQKIGKIFYKHFEIFAWLFTILFFGSGIYLVYSAYNLFAYGSCDPINPSNCPFGAGGIGCAQGSQQLTNLSETIKTFNITSNEICTKNGKPIIRLFSTTVCPHCIWIKDTYDKVAKEYADKGLVYAYHWELNTGDNTLTPQIEQRVLQGELDIYKKFNPQNTVPTFVFGCKYYRVGNGYEQSGDLKAEEDEFRAVIEQLINETSSRK